jgi:hypothetical protein
MQCLFTLQANGFCEALNDDGLMQRPEAMSYILTCFGLALQCETSPNAKIQLLNNIRTSKFLTIHLSIYFAKMMAEPSNATLRSFKQPIKAINFEL